MVKRFFQVVVVFFAIYSFVFVPLGKKTALEHLRAIFGTPAAREAAEEVKGGVTRLVRRLQSEARQSTEKTDRRLSERDAEQRDGARAAEDDELQTEPAPGEARAEREDKQPRQASPAREERPRGPSRAGSSAGSASNAQSERFHSGTGVGQSLRGTNRERRTSW